MDSNNVINLYAEEDDFRQTMIDYLNEYQVSYLRSLHGMINISEKKEHPRLRKIEKDLLMFTVKMQAFLIKASDSSDIQGFFLNDFLKIVTFKEKDNLSSLIKKNDLTELLYAEYGKKLFNHLTLLKLWFVKQEEFSETQQII